MRSFILVLLLAWIWSYASDLGQEYLERGESAWQDNNTTAQKLAVDWYEKSALAGNSNGMVQLADAYWNGQGRRADSLLARKWYLRAAELGNGLAMYNLGVIYENGSKVDSAEADKWYEKSALAGEDLGMLALGCAYLEGRGRKIDTLQAQKWFLRAAALGNSHAMYNLGVLCELGPKPDLKQALEWYEKAAQLDDSEAMNQLAWSLLNGKVQVADTQAALKWFQKSAQLENTDAMNVLSQILWDKMQDRTDTLEVFALLKKAAEAGNSNAMLNLAGAYAKGVAPRVDSAQSFFWMEKAAQVGNSFARIQVANRYQTGDQVPQNFQKAEYWFKQAMDAGDVLGMYRLAEMYFWNPQKRAKAKDLMQQAMALGSLEAQYYIAVEYGRGRYLPLDMAKSHAMLKEMALKGNSRAWNALGHMDELGLLPTAPAQTAFQYYVKSALDTNIEAMYSLGCSYLKGSGVARDSAMAKYWLGKGTKLAQELVGMGCYSLSYELGASYYYGLGVEKNTELALQVLETPVRLGIEDRPEYFVLLARIYQSAAGFADAAKAFKYWTRAAELGSSEAMRELSKSYQQGIGCAKNEIKAQEWSLRAEKQSPALSLEILCTSK